MKHRVINDDCVKALKKLPEASVDAVVCDPPYGLEFMGKEWDRLTRNLMNAEPDSADGKRKETYGGSYSGRCANLPDLSKTGGAAAQAWHEAWAREALRVLKPGGYLLAFGGTRTYHRMTCAIEDAGFEIRDQMQWLYGSGFPKSMNVGKAIDKKKGAKRKVVGKKKASPKGIKAAETRSATAAGAFGGEAKMIDVTEPSSKEAKQWEAWGTALKPAHEPIVVARKPLEGTVAENVLEHGTGAINIDGCRVGTEDNLNGGAYSENGTERNDGWGMQRGKAGKFEKPEGRWPANVILDEQAGQILDEQTGTLKSGKPGKRRKTASSGSMSGDLGVLDRTEPGRGDSGGASRFFYCPKASKKERNAGLEGFEEKQQDLSRKKGNPGGDNPRNRGVHKRANHHPTVKPIELMRYLIRLVCPPGGTVLDPFLGSGTTGCAAALEPSVSQFIGIERETEYIGIARARIKYWKKEARKAASNE